MQFPSMDAIPAICLPVDSPALSPLSWFTSLNEITKWLTTVFLAWIFWAWLWLLVVCELDNENDNLGGFWRRFFTSHLLVIGLTWLWWSDIYRFISWWLPSQNYPVQVACGLALFLASFYFGNYFELMLLQGGFDLRPIVSPRSGCFHVLATVIFIITFLYAFGYPIFYLFKLVRNSLLF